MKTFFFPKLINNSRVQYSFPNNTSYQKMVRSIDFDCPMYKTQISSLIENQLIRNFQFDDTEISTSFLKNTLRNPFFWHRITSNDTKRYALNILPKFIDTQCISSKEILSNALNDITTPPPLNAKGVILGVPYCSSPTVTAYNESLIIVYLNNTFFSRYNLTLGRPSMLTFLEQKNLSAINSNTFPDCVLFDRARGIFVSIDIYTPTQSVISPKPLIFKGKGIISLNESKEILNGCDILDVTKQLFSNSLKSKSHLSESVFTKLSQIQHQSNLTDINSILMDTNLMLHKQHVKIFIPYIVTAPQLDYYFRDSEALNKLKKFESFYSMIHSEIKNNSKLKSQAIIYLNRFGSPQNVHENGISINHFLVDAINYHL